MEFITNNYEWIFSGIGVAIIGWIIFGRKRNVGKQNNLKTTSTSSNTININNNIGKKNEESKSENRGKVKQGKENCEILFIDDNHSDFQMVSILKKAGWINTKGVQDLKDLDNHRAREASIIFVDINGVGSQIYKDQGLGLAAALKEKYPDKTIILYSADSTGDRFNKNLKKVDDSLPKNAEPYEFIRLIEHYS